MSIPCPFVSREVSAYTNESEKLWQKHALDLEPELWKQLCIKGYKSSSVFDNHSDLDLDELKTELRIILGRPLGMADVFSFKILVDASADFAQRKRRQIDVSWKVPTLRKTVSFQVHVSERAKAVAAIVQPSSNLYPHASSKRKPVDKEVRRIRLVDKLVHIVILCELPAAKLLSASVAPDRLAARMGAGKRVSTLEGQIRQYNRMKDFMTAVFGLVWPKTLIQVIDYIMELADQPCGPTVPPAVLSMLSFLEGIGAVAWENRLSEQPALKFLVNDLVLELSSDRPRAKRKAKQLLVAMAASWELIVLDWAYLEVTRIQFWVRLIKLWAALRTADLSGIPAGSLRFDGTLLSGTVTILKTTGIGKRVGLLTFYVSTDAWILGEKWLETGWLMFERHVTDRKFLLPLPCKDRGAFSSIEPDYQQACRTSRTMLTETPCFERNDDGEGFETWDIGPNKLLAAGMELFWSLHSERNTVNTWAAILEVEKSQRDNLGRWRPEDSDGYARNSCIIVSRIQGLVSKAIRNSCGKDIFGEEILLEELREFCSKRNLNSELVDKSCDRIRQCSRLCSILGLPGQPIPLDDLDDIKVVEAADQEEDEPPFGWNQLSKGARVVSLGKGDEERTLHIVGNCWRVPGIHYSRYVTLDDDEVGLYSKVCKDCLPSHGLEVPSESESESSSSDSSSDSD